MVVVRKKQRILREDKRQWKQQQQLFYEDGSIEEGAPYFAFRTQQRVHPPSSSSSSQHHAHLRFEDCVSSLIYCAKAKSLSEGMSLHACIVDHCLHQNKLLGDLLVQMYSRCDAMDDALSVFSNMQQKNLFTWNAIISAYACHGHHHEALQMFHQMRRDGFTPNKFIFASIISACSTRDTLHEGKDIHALIKECGLECDVVVGTALLNMYGKCGSMDDAKELFLMLPERDLVTWNAMIAVCAQHEQQWDALRLYHHMLQEGSLPDAYTFASVLDACVTLAALLPGKYIHASVVARGFDNDIVLGTALIDLYGKCGSLEGALATFELMPEHNRVTFINVLSACATYVAIDEGRRMHTQVIFYGFKLHVNLGNAFINMYGKCSSLIDAHKMFSDMLERDIISWNAVIAVYAQNGQVKNALSLFSQMQHEGVSPNSITFINILSACSHAGLINEGFSCFIAMERDHGVMPTVDHYNCVIDLLVRAGRLHEAEQLLNGLRIEPTSVSWTTLLGACRSEGDMQRGERIAKHVLILDPSNAAHHVTLANIYAAAGKVDDAAKTMNRLREMELDCGQ
eukprot:c24341_g3_i1 orf=222-1931(-)